MIIQISYDESSEAFERVKALVEASSVRDADLQGVDVIVERGDFTCIPDVDGSDATTVLLAVQAELRGQRSVPDGRGITIFGAVYDL